MNKKHKKQIGNHITVTAFEIARGVRRGMRDHHLGQSQKIEIAIYNVAKETIAQEIIRCTYESDEIPDNLNIDYKAFAKEHRKEILNKIAGYFT